MSLPLHRPMSILLVERFGSEGFLRSLDCLSGKMGFHFYCRNSQKREGQSVSGFS